MSERILAVDPGDRYCGMAYFVENRCKWAGEFGPGTCIKKTREMLYGDAVDVLVVEEFRLYPNRAAAQSYSQMKTPELIGVLRYLCADANDRGARVQWVQQSASIKNPTLSVLKARRVTKVARGSQHALDAETHGYAYILRDGGK